MNLHVALSPFDMTTNPIALNCLILGELPDFAFVVEIDSLKRIDHLKSAIKERRPDVFGNVPAVHLTLWRVDLAFDTLDEKLAALQSSSDLCIETTMGGEKLRALQQVDKAFPVVSDDETVHILIERPLGRSSVSVWCIHLGVISELILTTNRTAIACGLEKTLKRPRPVTPDEEEETDDVVIAEGSSKRNRLSTYLASECQDDEPDILAGYVLSQGSESSHYLAQKVQDKGLDYYYKAGSFASANSTWSIAKIDELLRVERVVFEFLKLHGLPQAWPADGLPIGTLYSILWKYQLSLLLTLFQNPKDACTAFMQLLAESGQGMLDESITKRYFLKLVRTFGDLVSSVTNRMLVPDQFDVSLMLVPDHSYVKSAPISWQLRIFSIHGTRSVLHAQTLPSRISETHVYGVH